MKSKESYIEQLNKMISLYESVNKDCGFLDVRNKNLDGGVCKARNFIDCGFDMFLIEIGHEISGTYKIYWNPPPFMVYENKTITLENKIYELSIRPRIEKLYKIKSIISQKSEEQIEKMYDNFIKFLPIL